MRQYASVAPTFWTRGSGKRLRGHPEAQVVALYLMTSPHTSMVGIFHLALPTLCHETGLSEEGARKGLARCSEEALAIWDEDEELVWIPALAQYQIGDVLKRGKGGKLDNRAKAVIRELAPFKGHRFFDLFMDRYADSYRLSEADAEGALEGLPSPIARARVVPAPVLVPDHDPDLAPEGVQGEPSPSLRAPPETSRVPMPFGSLPHSLDDALKIPVHDRATLVLDHPEIAQYTRPERWPEVLELAKVAREATGWKNLSFGQYERDSGIRALVALFVTVPPVDPKDLADGIRGAGPYLREKGPKAGVSSLTPEVVRRGLEARQKGDGGGFGIVAAVKARQEAEDRERRRRAADAKKAAQAAGGES